MLEEFKSLAALAHTAPMIEKALIHAGPTAVGRFEGDPSDLVVMRDPSKSSQIRYSADQFIIEIATYLKIPNDEATNLWRKMLEGLRDRVFSHLDFKQQIRFTTAPHEMWKRLGRARGMLTLVSLELQDSTDPKLIELREDVEKTLAATACNPPDKDEGIPALLVRIAD